MLGLAETLYLLNEQIEPLPGEELALLDAADRTLGTDVLALVDSPSVDASLKDGYAVVSEDIARASEKNTVTLRVTGTTHAGDDRAMPVSSGAAARILTGAALPAGASSVVAEEFTRRDGTDLHVLNTAEPGRNVLFWGSDIEKDGLVARRGSRVTPGMLGFIAAAGHNRVTAIRQPVLAIIATGDEKFQDWTQFFYGKLNHTTESEPPLFITLIKKSRLRSMAEAEAIVSIPEGVSILEENSIVPAQLLD